MELETPKTTLPTRADRFGFFLSVWEEMGMLILFVIMFVVASLTVPFFFTFPNMIGLSNSVCQVGMLACTMLFCLGAADVDLSIGAVVAFAGVFVAVMMQLMPGQVVVPILLTLVLSLGVGFFNGFVIAKLGLNALIATLATMQIFRGLAFRMSNGVAVGIASDQFFLLGNGVVGKIPFPVWVTVACFVIFGLLLNRTVYGRNTLAIGGNKEAARLSGINVEWTRMTIFALQGLMAGAAGIMLASKSSIGQPNASQGFELDVISACVLGGVSLNGGIGTITGVIAGVLIMGTVQNVLSLQNVDYFWQYVVRGTVLLLAVLFDQFKQRHAGV
jgi:L-arabinose transport system permease protein